VGNLARKIIDAVQNTMLDRLVVRLFPLLWIWSMWDRMAPSKSGTASLMLILGIFALLALHWVLGALADEPLKPRRGNPYDAHAPRAPSAWDKQPEGGVRPPAFIRAFVMAFGAGGRGWISIIEGLVFAGAFTLTWMLAHNSEAFWSDLHQGLAEQVSRERLFLAVSVILIALLIRGWAVEQRERLSPSADRVPVIGSILLGVVFATLLGMWLSDLLGFGLLPGVIGGVGVLAIAVGPPWREKVLEFLFGKRAPADSRS